MQKQITLQHWITCLIIIFTTTVCSGNDIGRELEKALQARSTGSPEDVTQLFNKVADEASRPEQKASILSFLAEYLMKNQAWPQAVEVYQRILQEGAETDKPWAYYGIAQAYYLSGQHSNARDVCIELVTKYPGNSMEAFAREMRAVAPNCVHAKLAAFMMLSPLFHGETQTIEMARPYTEATQIGINVPTTTKPAEMKANKKLKIRIDGWKSDLSGMIDAKGMNLNLENATDIDAKTMLMAKAEWQVSNKNQVKIEYSKFEHSGSLMKAVTYDNLTYSPGASVKLKTNFLDVELSHLLNETRHSVWQLLCGVKFSNLFMRLEQQMIAGIRTGELDQNFRVPYMGITCSNRLSDNISLNATIKSFSFNYSGAKARMTDFDLALLIGKDYAKHPSENEWYGTLGYRYFLMRGKSDGDLSEVIYSGPTFGVESRF